MRILLGQGLVYAPSFGGANRSNRLLLEALAARGHACRAVAPCDPATAASAVADVSSDSVEFEQRGVRVHAVRDRSLLLRTFARQIDEHDPDAVIVSSEDIGQALLRVAVRADSRRVTYLARTTMALPFGPGAAVINTRSLEWLRQAGSIVALTGYIKDYCRQWAGLDPVVLPISLFDPLPETMPEPPADGAITLINPCAVKGLSIFLDLARRLPALRFAAVPTWGTTTADREALARLPNVEIWEAADDVDTIFRRTRVLLVPSLWAEAAGRVVIEAMARGIPVLASNVGGLPEMKRGVPYVLPVRPIAAYRPTLDERLLPVAEVPEQDVAPWVAALGAITADCDAYRRIGADSRRAALAHLAEATIDPFERHLAEVVAKRGLSPSCPC
jgi:glycosyltransferase involved in cell wall biosynthesis